MPTRKLALERLEPRALLAVYTVDSAGLANPLDAFTSFEEAFAVANGTAEPDVIEFAPALTGSTITLGGPMLGNSPTIAYDLEIRGLGADQLTFIPSSEHFTGFFTQNTATQVTISGATFAPRIAGGSTRYILSLIKNFSGEARLQDVVATALIDPAITSSGGSVTLVDTRLIADPMANLGPGVSANQNLATVRMERSEVRGFKRGGILAAGDVSVVDSTIADNGNGLGGSTGSGVRSTGGRVDVTGSTISGNYLQDATGGGGISARWGATVVDSTVSGNWARFGGGVHTQDGPLTILRSTISDNRATSTSFVGGGGAAKEGTTGAVIVSQSTFSGNRVMATFSGGGSNGGGLFSTRPIEVTDSTFTDNYTTYALSAGGAIYAPNGGSIVRSHFENNRVVGQDSDGGAIWTVGNLTIDRSTFRNNSTNGNDGDGGAVHMGPGLVSNSTFVGNQTLGPHSDGGAIGYFGGGGTGLTIVNSTITDNATVREWSDGGGIYIFSNGNLNVRFSTVAGNQVQHNLSRGGAISLGDPNASGVPSASLTLWHSILADNTAVGGNPNLYLKNNGVASNYSLIEDTAGLTAAQLAAIDAGAGNILGVDPLLAPLADNGGPTLTRAPLPGSPALDAGDPTATYATPNLPLYDQRGFPYQRIAGARVDLGAVEVQTTPHYADFDRDFDVDGADFLAWQRGLGTLAPAGTKAAGDADNDADVDADDLNVWSAQFGMPTAAAAASALSDAAVYRSATADSGERSAVDALFASGDFTNLFVDAKTTTRKLRLGRRAVIAS